MRELYKYLLHYFREIEQLQGLAKPLAALLVLISIFLIAWLAFFLTRRVVLPIFLRMAKRTRYSWDDILARNKVFNALAYLVPGFIFYYSGNFASATLQQPLAEATPELLKLIAQDYYPALAPFLFKLAKIYFTTVVVYLISTLLNAGNEFYQATPYANHRSIKGYIQLLKILTFFLAAILIISILLDKDPTVLIAGLGAMAAVLLLVFKDTILGLVASIQLSANDMLKIGDWIEMPSHRADGNVIDITLNTVKVQNWDKTITTIPTYALVSESFNNWRGMEESEGRRIKRAIYIDVGSIRFCTEEMLKRFHKFDLIKDYVISKEQEIKQFNLERHISEEDVISGRRQTNVGIFRKYLEVYLRSNPLINQEMTLLVRQLQPAEKGLPIEIYAFSKDKAWANYEALQADIFDHVLAVIPEFDLRIFQSPTGSDMKSAFSSVK